MGLYSDTEVTHTVGDPLPGGQGVITQMPDDGDCCQLAKVTLPNDGVLLSAGVHYWLALTPDDENAPTFHGEWRLSNRAAHASLEPPDQWDASPGQWPAAQIRGTKVQTAEASNVTSVENLSRKRATRAGNITIFTNLGPTLDDRYDFNEGVPIRGSKAGGEIWFALPFIPRADVHARTIGAAVSWQGGEKLVRLGLYSDNDGVPGTPLPGGEASTSDIPTFGQCCELTKVTFPDPGIALEKGVRTWLVVSPDPNAPDFDGNWSPSNLAVSAYEEPEMFISWTSFSAVWLAARIEGTSP